MSDYGCQFRVGGSPVHRLGAGVKLLIGALLFLASPEAAGFITGIVLPVDGGFSAYSGV